MYESTKMGISNDMLVCRLCDKKVEERRSKYIFDEADLAQKINVTLPIKVAQDDDNSKLICLQCYNKVISYYDFCQDILKSEKNSDESKINCLFKINKNKELTTSDILNLDKDLTFMCPNCNISLMILIDSKPNDSEHPFQVSLAVVDQMKRLIREKIVPTSKPKTVRVITPKKLSAVNKLHSSSSNRDNCTEIFNKICKTYPIKDEDCKDVCIPSTVKEEDASSLDQNSSLKPEAKRKRSCRDSDKKLVKEKQSKNDEEIEAKFWSNSDDEWLDGVPNNVKLTNDNVELPESQKWTCQICSASYFQRLRYDFHMERHALNKMRDTVCIECDLRMVNELLLFDHFRRAHTFTQHICLQCDEKYLTKIGLENHQKMKKHAGVAEYMIDPEQTQLLNVLTCTLCGKSVQETEMNICNDVVTCLDCDTSISSMMVDGYEKRFIAQRQFHCAKCNTRFIRKDRLEFHMMRHNENKEDVVCSTCGKDFCTENSLFEHYMFVHKGARPFICELCGKSFQLKMRLKEHLRTHTGEKPYQCDKCGMRCTTSNSLRLHSKTHISGAMYTCEVCHKSYRKKQNWIDHLEKHWIYDENVALSQWFTCPLCMKTLPTFRMVKRHLVDDHQIDRKDPLVTNQQPYFECSECNEKFKHQMSLKAHREKTHEGKTSPIYECDLCKQTFKIKQLLINHIKYKHGGKKRYKCAQCGKRFNDTKSLYNHILLHIGRKPFACDYCDKKFQRKDSRDIHRRNVHTGERPFCCRLCDESFFSYNDRARHRKIAHKDGENSTTTTTKKKTPEKVEIKVDSASQEDQSAPRQVSEQKPLNESQEIVCVGDDVQRSIELLDKVLSEYDEHDAEGEGGGGSGGGCVGGGNGGVVGDCGSSTEPSIGLTPDDESPSLGHQSEDDGYMSMNGRKAKMALVALRPVPDCPEPQDPAGVSTQEFPPPPEEAERIISTLLPMVSPGNSSKRSVVGSDRRSNVGGRQQWMVTVEDSMRHGNAVTTQTTLPKTRHQRPYGWENGPVESLRLAQPSSPPSKFGSLPYDGKVSFNWIPPRTNPSAVEKHREVRRRSSDECLEDDDGRQRVRISSPDRGTSHLRKQPRQQNEIMKSSSVEDRLLMNRTEKELLLQSSSSSSAVAARRRNDSDSSEGRFSRNSESEASRRSSMPRSSSVSVERFSMRANCDSSDFSRANSTSNERFHSDFSIAVASASGSNDHVSSVPTSDPFSIRNLDFVSFSLPRADSSERFSAPTSDRCSDERYSDLFSTRNSDFSTRNSADFRTQSEEERFSDDSLEELLPPPPPISKRHSIAWEVSLEDDPLYAPGSTKVVGRRRRKSSDVSSVGSASKLRDFDDWQDQRLSTTDDDLISPYSDSSTNELDQIRPQELTKNGTYVIRRGRKKERKVLPKTPTKTKSLSFENGEDGRLSDVKRYSSTFDNIKSLLKEGKLEGLDEPPAEFTAPVPPPDLIRVVSMPAIDTGSRGQLEITVEEEETDVSDKDKERDNIELPQLPPSPVDEDQTESRPDRSRDCNGVPSAPTLADLDNVKSSANVASESSKKKLAQAASDERLVSKIPVNLLIEDQIVKKALKENRRQLEKVSDAIKEIENVKNSESYCESKRWRNGDVKQSSKRNSFEYEGPLCHDGRKPAIVDGSPFDSRTSRGGRQQYSSDSETSKASSDADFADRRKPNGATDVIYSSGRRLRQNGIENHKNDQKQIENVIDAILEDSKNPEFQVSVDVMEFPPLPPSPVEEADEESCSDVGGQSAVITPPKSRSHNRTVEYRPRVPPHRVPPVIDSKEQASLNTRSMDAGYARGRRTPTANNSRREVPVERRTLPTDLPGPSRRRPFTKRHSPSAEPCSSGGSSGGGGGGGGGTGGSVATGTGSGMQTSCSLPETPVFARGSDIPRTPQHAGNPTQSRRQPGWYAPTTATGYRRNNPGLEQAIIGTELLRLAGGPNRGWYPTRKANQPRPASIEHLERLNNAYDARLPGTGDQRKPLTLPTNITPNKYFGQSKHSSASSTREALRRVTSLLIKKGSGSKDGKNKDNNSPSGPYAGAESGDAPKKKGFFKGFWKRSRHYSLENQ